MRKDFETGLSLGIEQLLVFKVYFLFADQDVGSEDFLPALSYVLVQCNIPQLLLETEYMMELLEPSWLTGEGKNKHILTPFKTILEFVRLASNGSNQ